MVQNVRISDFRGLLTLTLDPGMVITFFSSVRVLPVYQISSKSKKLFVDGRTYGHTDRSLEVDLKIRSWQNYVPSRQSTAPRRRRRCRACRVLERQAGAACVVLSVPAARGNDARRCPDDCAPPATHGPTSTSPYIIHAAAASLPWRSGNVVALNQRG